MALDNIRERLALYYDLEARIETGEVLLARRSARVSGTHRSPLSRSLAMIPAVSPGVLSVMIVDDEAPARALAGSAG
jgi:hypothetical protein